MVIEVSKVIGLDILREACSFTINAESQMDLAKAYHTGHSPCRTQMFVVRMYDIPTFVSIHLVRHKIGVEHFVKSNREDRPGYTGDTGRNHPVNHMMFLNAQALITMAHERLCSSASDKTREIMRRITDEVRNVDPDLAHNMVPKCVYRNGICSEPKCCGYRGGK